MGLGNLLDDIRQHYVNHYVAAVEQLRRHSSAEIRTEVALCDAVGKPVCEGQLHLPLRVDALLVEDGVVTESISIHTNKMLSFEPVSFEWADGLNVILGPFVWCELELRLPRLDRRMDWAELRTWFTKWFREDEDGEGELLGMIHFLSDPKKSGEAVCFTIDLGSAPVEAFEELLDVIAALGVSEICLGKAQ